MKFFALLSLLLIISAPFAAFTYNGSINGSADSDGSTFYQFSKPTGLLYREGTLYVADGGKGAVYLYDASTNSRIKAIVGTAGTLPVQSPLHMAYDSGILYIADSLGQAVMTYSGAGYNLDTWAAASNLIQPSSLVFDSKSVYITDLGKEQLLQYSRSTKSYQNITIDKGPSDGQLSAPQEIKFYKGKYYIVDSDKSLIFVYDQNFTFLSLMGRGRGGVTLASPRGLDIFDDRIYVADYGNARVIVYSLDGYPIDSLDSSPLNNLSYPMDVAVGNGMLYVADGLSREIKFFSINYTDKNDSVLQMISAANQSIQVLNSLQATADKLNLFYEKTGAAQDLWMSLVDYGNFQFSSSAALASKAFSESDSAQGALTQDIKVKVLQVVKVSQDKVTPYRNSGVSGIKDNLAQFDNRVADINAKISQGSYAAAADAALTLFSLAENIGSTVVSKQAEAVSRDKNTSFASFSRDYSDLLGRLNSVNQEAQVYRQETNLSSSENYLNQSLAQAGSGDFS
ncbi:MAG: NHL repeat-containing protein, partial [Candidatus Micrarchaeota archaeon]|nr:NHL repeat-containing protein [Candidatus Micrarchaeota archaeon]